MEKENYEVELKGVLSKNGPGRELNGSQGPGG